MAHRGRPIFPWAGGALGAPETLPSSNRRLANRSPRPVGPAWTTSPSPPNWRFLPSASGPPSPSANGRRSCARPVSSSWKTPTNCRTGLFESPEESALRPDSRFTSRLKNVSRRPPLRHTPLVRSFEANNHASVSRAGCPPGLSASLRPSTSRSSSRSVPSLRRSRSATPLS